MKMTLTDYAGKVLKEGGYRLTSTRLAVVKRLATTKKPLSAYEIAQKIRAGKENIDTVTVYRILEVYEKLGLVHKTRQGYMPCGEFKCQEPEHCHHQFVCEKCHKAQEIHFSDRDFVAELGRKFSNLLIQSHYFEFSGFCAKCKNIT